MFGPPFPCRRSPSRRERRPRGLLADPGRHCVGDVHVRAQVVDDRLEAQAFRVQRGVVRESEEQNIDGAALNYVQVILTCVQRHKLVREGGEIAQLDGPDPAGSLLQRQLAGLVEGL